MFKKKGIPKKGSSSCVKLAVKWISGSLTFLSLLSWTIVANGQLYFAVVSSGISRKLDAYRSPYTFGLAQDPYPRTLTDVVGMGIAGSNDSVYVWYKDGTVSSGTSWDLAQYKPPYEYALPPRGSVVAIEGVTQPVYTPQDIVGIAIAGSNDHVYVWYKDGYVSSGSSSNLHEHSDPYKYALPEGKVPEDIVGMGITGSDDSVYAWYKDGTVSSGTSWNLAQYKPPYKYTLPPGASPEDIVGMGITGADGPGPRDDDYVYVWYRSKGAESGDLAAVDWCYDYYEPSGMGQTITITFRPRIKNVGSLGFSSPKEGSYTIGVSWGSAIEQKTHKLLSFPSWFIGPQEIKSLPGVTVPFHPENTYIFRGWHFTHPYDTKSENNEFSPDLVPVKGYKFKQGLVPKNCRSEDVSLRAKQLDVLINLESITVIDEGDGSGNAEPYLWTVFFKIDATMMVPNNFYDPKSWSHTPGGEHGNIGKDYDAGQTRVVPAKYGQWKTTLRQNPVYFPKDHVYVGAVVVLLEEDDFPSSNDVANEYYPEFTDIVTRKLQCLFLKSLNEKVIALKAKNDPIATIVELWYNKLSQKASELDCDNEPTSTSGAGNGQGFGNLVSEAEKELQERVISKLVEPWYVWLLPVLPPFINIDDFIGGKIFIWKWADLEIHPWQTFETKWSKSTGSEDGSFELRVDIRAFPTY